MNFEGFTDTGEKRYPKTGEWYYEPQVEKPFPIECFAGNCHGEGLCHSWQHVILKKVG